jgi:hypothetical protein
MNERVVTVFNELGQLVWIEWRQPADLSHTLRVRIGQKQFFVSASGTITNLAANTLVHIVTVSRSTKAGGFEIDPAGVLAQPQLPVTSQELTVDPDWSRIQSPF